MKRGDDYGVLRVVRTDADRIVGVGYPDGGGVVERQGVVQDHIPEHLERVVGLAGDDGGLERAGTGVSGNAQGDNVENLVAQVVGSEVGTTGKFPWVVIFGGFVVCESFHNRAVVAGGI